MPAKKPQYTLLLDNPTLLLESVTANTAESKLPGAQQWTCYGPVVGGTLYLLNDQFDSATSRFSKITARLRDENGQITCTFPLPAAIQAACIKAEADCFLFLTYDNEVYCYTTTGTLLYKSNLSSYNKNDGRLLIDFDPATRTAIFGIDRKIWRLEKGEKVTPLTKTLPSWLCGLLLHPGGQTLWAGIHHQPVLEISSKKAAPHNHKTSSHDSFNRFAGSGDFQVIHYGERMAFFQRGQATGSVPVNKEDGYNGYIHLYPRRGVLLYIGQRRIKVCTLSGQLLNCVDFDSPIYDAYFAADRLTVVTTHQTFTFTVQPGALPAVPAAPTLPAGYQLLADRAVSADDRRWVLEDGERGEIKTTTYLYRPTPTDGKERLVAEVFPTGESPEGCVTLSQKGDDWIIRTPGMDLRGAIGPWKSRGWVNPESYLAGALSDCLGTAVQVAQALMDEEEIEPQAESWFEHGAEMWEQGILKEYFVERLDCGPDEDSEVLHLLLRREGDQITLTIPALELDGISVADEVWGILQQAADQFHHHSNIASWEELEKSAAWKREPTRELGDPSIEDEGLDEETDNDDEQSAPFEPYQQAKSRACGEYQVRVVERHASQNSTITRVEISGHGVAVSAEYEGYVEVEISAAAQRVFTKTISELHCHSLATGQELWAFPGIPQGPHGEVRLHEAERWIDLGKPWATGDDFILRLDYDGRLVQRNASSGYELLSWANERLKAGNVEEAAALYRRALESAISENTQASVHRVLGELSETGGDLSTALAHYEAALRLNPNVGIKKHYETLKKGKK